MVVDDSTCRTCGASLSSGQRFCSSCGDPADDVLLVDAAPRVSTGSAVTTDRRAARPWLVGLGLGLLGLLGWSVVASSGGSDLASDPDGEAVESVDGDAESSGADDPTAEDDDPQSTTTSDTGSDGADSEDVVDDVEPAASGGGGVDEDPDTVDDAANRGADPAGGVLEDSGLSLVVGTPVRLIDLDTGEEEGLAVSGSPMVSIDRHLVVRNGGSGLRVVNLDDLDGDPLEVGGPNEYVMAVSEGGRPGSIIALVNRFDGSTDEFLERVIDLESGLVLSEEPAAVLDWPPTLGDGRFTSPNAGGVYEQIGDEFRQVSDGRLVVEGDNVLLIETCDETMSCTQQWVSTDGLEPVDFPAPTFVGHGQLLANDRFLVSSDVGAWTYDVLDVTTGEVVQEGLHYVESFPVAEGPNGEYISFRTEGVVVVLEAETGRRIEIDRVYGDSTPLLIETP